MTYPQRALLQPSVCAILAPGQYRGACSLDLHRGQYEALCQRNGPVRVYRDSNRDARFDLYPERVSEGFFGINIHAPATPSAGLRNYIRESVAGASAGCHVSQRMADFLEFRDLCRSARKWWGNRFTYTLIDGES